MAKAYIRKESEEVLNEAEGGLGFDRIAGDGSTPAVCGSATYPDTTVWVAVKAIGGDAEFEAACVAAVGDVPSDGDVIAQGDILLGRFTTLVLASGSVVYAYRGK